MNSNIKNKFNPDHVIIGVSLILIIIRLYWSQFLLQEYYSFDYYGYIELAKNIFNHLNFTVPWEIDSPVQYPPLFSILIYLLTRITHNYLSSIIYINIFSTSLYIVPLYFLVKNVLNIYAAILAVVFAVFYFGVYSCYTLSSDCFYSFLIIVICWLISEILINRPHQEGQYVFAGFLIGLAYLTKYSAILFGFASAAAVLYFFSCHQKDVKTGLKMSAFLLLGAAPLLIVYQLLLYASAKGQGNIPNIGTYSFIDGNYNFQVNEDKILKLEKKYQLNPQGTEFSNLSVLRSTNVPSFILKNPSFVLKKMIWGSKRAFNYISYFVSPFLIRIKGNEGVIFQYTFLFLLIFCGIYFKWHFKMMLVLFFTAGMVFVPLYYVYERYYMPFVPLYFILWLFIFTALYLFLKNLTANKRALKYAALIFFFFSLSFYSFKGSVRISKQLAYWGHLKMNKSWVRAASWIKNDARDNPQRIKIMGEFNYFSYVTDAEFITLPYGQNWDEIVNFALLRHVNYIVIDDHPLTTSRFIYETLMGPSSFRSLINSIALRSNISSPVSTKEPLDWILRYQDLYKNVLIWPYEKVDLIRKLEQGRRLEDPELKELNLLILKYNYPPDHEFIRKLQYKRLYLNIDRLRTRNVKLIHQINVNKQVVDIVKIQRE